MPTETMVETQSSSELICPGDRVFITSHIHLCQALQVGKKGFEAPTNTPQNLIPLLDQVAGESLQPDDKLVVIVTVHGWDIESLRFFQDSFSDYFSTRPPSFLPLFSAEAYTIPDSFRQDGRLSLIHLARNFTAQHLLVILEELPSTEAVSELSHLINGHNTLEDIGRIQQILETLTILAHPTPSDFKSTCFSLSQIPAIKKRIDINGIELNAKHALEYIDPLRYVKTIRDISGSLDLALLSGLDAHHIQDIPLPQGTATKDLSIFDDTPSNISFPIKCFTFFQHQGPVSSPFEALKFSLEHHRKDLTHHCAFYYHQPHLYQEARYWPRGGLTFMFGQVLRGHRRRLRREP